MSTHNEVADVAMEELGDVVIRALKKATRRLMSQGLEKDSATKVAVAHVLGCCSGALCVAFNRDPPPDAKVIHLIRDTEAVLMKYTEPRNKQPVEVASTGKPRRIDSEGRDVTDLPGIWSETDKISGL